MALLKQAILLLTYENMTFLITFGLQLTKVPISVIGFWVHTDKKQTFALGNGTR